MPTAVVTGASGGVGQSLVAELLLREFHVVGVDSADAPGPTSRRYKHVRADLGELDQITDLAKNLPISTGLLIHSAAVQPLLSAGSGHPQVWSRAFAVNVLSLEMLTAQLKPALVANEPHAVLAIGSIHDRQTSSSMAPYSVSKAALAAWIRAAAIDLAPSIQLLNIGLGATDTPMLKANLEQRGDHATAEATLRSSLLSTDFIDPNNFATFCLSLLGPMMPHLTGTTIRVDSGASIRLGGE